MGFDEGLPRAVIGALAIGRKEASGQLAAGIVVVYAEAAFPALGA